MPKRVVSLPAAAAILCAATAAHAADPGVVCEAGKLKTAGKYASCVLGADSKAVRTSTAADYTRCVERFDGKWQILESNGGGVCSDGDATGIQGFVDGCTQSVADALAGGTLPDCPGDLATCNADLTTCDGALTTCTGNYGTCTTDLGTCASDLSTAQNDLTTCNGSLTSCTGSLSACSASLTTCNGDLTTCTGGLSTCSADLTTCNANYTGCASSLATCNAGTAVAADVLDGQTFSSGAGLGVAGTMANVGQQNVPPGTAPVAITQGYHDGTGAVAGDVDLIAGNIASGVSIFGVAGTALPSRSLRTGQTTAYTADKNDGIPGAVAVPDDGTLQRGAALSYVDNGNGTITDLNTGLVWEKKGDNGGLHDKDNVYLWRGNGAQETIWDWRDDVNAEGGTGFAGFNDWRIPNAKELVSIVNYQTSPAVHPVFNAGCAGGCSVLACSCIQPGVYWSSTTFILNPANSAWRIGFDAGGIIAGDKATFLDYVRAVRGG